MKKSPKNGAFVYKFVYRFYKSLIFKVYCGERGTTTFETLQFHFMPKLRKFSTLANIMSENDMIQCHTMPQKRQKIVYKIVYLENSCTIISYQTGTLPVLSIHQQFSHTASLPKNRCVPSTSLSPRLGFRVARR